MAGVKIYITTNGDPSVGIQGEHITINWPGLEEVLCDYGARPAGLKILERAVQDLCGEKATARFVDEGDADDPGFGRPR